MYACPRSESTGNSTGGESISPSVACWPNFSPCASARKPDAVLCPETARAEMDADPQPAVVVAEEVDVVIAGADRPELICRELPEIALRHEVGVSNGVEHRVIDRLVVRAAHPERDPRDDLVHDGRDGNVVGAEVCPHRLVPAADVVADSGRRDVVAVGDDAADRLRVADVRIRAEGRGDRIARLCAAA